MEDDEDDDENNKEENERFNYFSCCVKFAQYQIRIIECHSFVLLLFIFRCFFFCSDEIDYDSEIVSLCYIFFFT